jgi:hypothetical protein
LASNIKLWIRIRIRKNEYGSTTLTKIIGIKFCEICGYIKRYDKNFFSPLSFVPVFGSGIRDPGSEIRDPGWVKIRIRDKHPGSATLVHRTPRLGLKYPLKII